MTGGGDRVRFAISFSTLRHHPPSKHESNRLSHPLVIPARTRGGGGKFRRGGGGVRSISAHRGFVIFIRAGTEIYIYIYVYLIRLNFLLCLLVSKGVVRRGGNCRNFKTIRRISVAAEGLFMVAATRVPWRWLSYRPCPDNCSVFAMEGVGGVVRRRWRSMAFRARGEVRREEGGVVGCFTGVSRARRALDGRVLSSPFDDCRPLFATVSASVRRWFSTFCSKWVSGTKFGPVCVLGKVWMIRSFERKSWV